MEHVADAYVAKLNVKNKRACKQSSNSPILINSINSEFSLIDSFATQIAQLLLEQVGYLSNDPKKEN